MDQLNELVKKFDVGIDGDRLTNEFESLLPEIENIGWWSTGTQHQYQFAVQSLLNSENPYHESCGPQPTLNKNDSENPLTEGSFNVLNDLFAGTYFEEILSMFPIEVTRVRILKLNPKCCYRFHRDMTYKFHIPLITNPSNMFIFPEQYHKHILHLPADGHVYYVDTSVPHTFLNGGNEERYHIVLSSTLDKEILLSNFPNEKDLGIEHFPTLDEKGEWK